MSDVRTVLDSLDPRPAVLVGHSLAGAVMTRFAEQYPGRVAAVIYLDAVGERAGFDSVVAKQPTPRPRPDPILLATAEGLRAFAAATSYGRWSPAAEADFQARPVGDERARRERLIAPLLQDFTLARPSYMALKSPILAICVISGMASDFSWARADSARLSDMDYYLRLVLQPFQRRGCQRLKREAPHAQFEEFESWHYVFLAEPDRITRRINDFLAQSVR